MINKRGVKGLLLLLSLCIFGCASVKNSIVPAGSPGEINQLRKVALFPFADYSHQQDFLDPEIWGGNIRILEEIPDHTQVFP